MTIRNAYLPTTLISDKGSAFVSQAIKGLTGVLGIYSKPRHYEARANKWAARTISRVN